MRAFLFGILLFFCSIVDRMVIHSVYRVWIPCTVTVQFDRSNDSRRCVCMQQNDLFLCAAKTVRHLFLLLFFFLLYTQISTFFSMRTKMWCFPSFTFFCSHAANSSAESKQGYHHWVFWFMWRNNKKNRWLSVIVVIFGIRLRLNHVRCVLFAFRWEFPYANTKLQLEMMKKTTKRLCFYGVFVVLTICYVFLVKRKTKPFQSLKYASGKRFLMKPRPSTLFQTTSQLRCYTCLFTKDFLTQPLKMRPFSVETKTSSGKVYSSDEADSWVNRLMSIVIIGILTQDPNNEHQNKRITVDSFRWFIFCVTSLTW